MKLLDIVGCLCMLIALGSCATPSDPPTATPDPTEQKRMVATAATYILLNVSS